jgi:RNA polymerase sigma-70 factor (ECF subfamily)
MHDEMSHSNGEAPRPDRDPPPSCDAMRAWIEAARSGSIEAFGQLFTRCRGYLLAVANEEMGTTLREKSRPSSLVQRTMITAQERFDRFRGASEGELLAWLRGILLNHISDLSKYFHREKRHMGRELSLERDLDGADRGGLVADERTTPGHKMLRDEEAEDLVRALARLPDDYREVIVLRNWERLPLDEVGRRMQRSGDAARKLWTRAIDALRQELESADGRNA